MRLNEFQECFKDLMLDTPEALERPPADLAKFCRKDHMTLPARLGVYRNNIIGSITDMLVATFPLLEKLVGKEFLASMARRFLRDNPPTDGCLNLYGNGFAEFIENFAPAKGLPYLPDMARLELAMNKAYYARDDAPLKAKSLANIAPDSIGDTHLRLRDSVHLIFSPYPLIALQEFCLAEGMGEPPDLEQGQDYLMVYRPYLDIETIALESSEYELLKNLQNKQVLEEAVSAVIGIDEAFDFQAFLQRHLALETFSTLSTNG